MSTPQSSLTQDQSLRPYIALDPFDAMVPVTIQQAITEGRLEGSGDYQFAGPSNRASYMTVVTGVATFFVAIAALTATVTAYLARTHQNSLQLEGGLLLFLIICNAGLGYLQLSVHEGLHGLVHQLAGGSPQYLFEENYTYHWSAPNQAFSRRFYTITMLAPLAFFTLLWLIVLLVAPGVAAFILVPFIVNLALSGSDCWLVWAAQQQTATSIFFVRINDGFITYTVAPAKTSRKRAATTSLKRSTNRA